MKKILSTLIVIVFVFATNNLSFANTKKTTNSVNKSIKTIINSKIKSASKLKYKDGVYMAKSSSTPEGYYGKAKITIFHSLIKKVDFEIFDTGIFKQPDFNKNIPNYKTLKELGFDEKYGPTIYYNYPVYQNQCIRELAGIKKYISILVKNQDTSKVDTISGATWSHGIFVETINNTLAKAK
jgi:uncharacterized protein with FMN-binding domain